MELLFLMFAITLIYFCFKNKYNPTQNDLANYYKLQIANKYNTILKKYICKRCPKATSISVECINCGHPMEKVFCDDDLTNGQHRLRNPNFLICKSSPQYEFIFRKTV